MVRPLWMSSDDWLSDRHGRNAAASLSQFPIRAPSDTVPPTAPTPPPIRVNRAPVLTLWATVVAERLGQPPETAP
jgi:hypothetical protein